MIVITINLSETKSKPITFHDSSAVGEIPHQNIIVDIEGSVNKPGIYHMLTSQRVHDAITAAGGLSPQADTNYVTRELNMASYLHDQDKMYIPHIGEKPINPVPSLSITLSVHSVSINKATVNEIDVIPGIGKTTALKIIQNRPYSNIKELIDKKIVPTATYKKIEKYIYL